MRWRDRSLLIWLVVCLVILLVAAFYLRSQQVAQPAPDAERVDESEAPENEPPEPEESEEENEPQDTLPPSGRSDFYVEQRLERDRLRSQVIDTLREIIHNPNSDAVNRAEAHAKLLEVSQAIAKEAELEGLIKAKNFPDALVYLNENGVRVLVKVPEITTVQAAQIGDIVATSTGLPLEKIIIDTRP